MGTKRNALRIKDNRIKQEFYLKFEEMVKRFLDTVKTENDIFLPTFKDEILLVDLLRKRKNYPIKIFDEAIENFKLNSSNIFWWDVEEVLFDYKREELCYDYLPKLEGENKRKGLGYEWLDNSYNNLLF